jgi:hypothetical protein
MVCQRLGDALKVALDKGARDGELKGNDSVDSFHSCQQSGDATYIRDCSCSLFFAEELFSTIL